jgi:hypothetical protein
MNGGMAARNRYRQRRARAETIAWELEQFGEAEQPRKSCRQPRPGDVLLTATRPRIVARASDRGRVLELLPDELARAETVDRDPAGHWTVLLTRAEGFKRR